MKERKSRASFMKDFMEGDWFFSYVDVKNGNRRGINYYIRKDRFF
jgi:hypothetical protein